MNTYFGTDGIRGVANEDLTPELCFSLGRILGNILKNDEEKVNVLIGHDTRISGEMLEYAVISGLLSSGANVMRLGVISTPGVAYLTKSLNATCGIMISASHNPYTDNGIKIFGSDGYKLNDELEQEIEKLLFKDDQLPRALADQIGVVDDYFEGQHKYLNYIQKSINNTFEGLKISIDCANGATSNLAPHLFANLGAEVLLINNVPNGTNINVNCGSTYIDTLKQHVIENKVDLGIAFDGDGDRLIVIDENGEEIDGDGILYILGSYLKEMNQLNKETIVTTVMSNIGLYKAFEQLNINTTITQVGDRHVLENMVENQYNLGGEQSGHIILADYATTGDGLLTAVHLVNVIIEKKASLSELIKGFVRYPQQLKNMKVNDKEAIMDLEVVQQKIQSIASELGSEGRILVRPSGTEDLLRIMVEATTEEIVQKYIDEMVECIKQVDNQA